MKLTRFAGVILLGLLTLAPSAFARGGQAILSQQEVQYLYFMREEEKLARDVYLVMYREWGL